jgi:hypothetical protein
MVGTTGSRDVPRVAATRPMGIGPFDLTRLCAVPFLPFVRRLAWFTKG